jgi:hypothetical protein
MQVKDLRKDKIPAIIEIEEVIFLLSSSIMEELAFKDDFKRDNKSDSQVCCQKTNWRLQERVAS